MSDQPFIIHYTGRDGPDVHEAPDQGEAVEVLRTLAAAGIEDARVGSSKENAMSAAVWLVAVTGNKP